MRLHVEARGHGRDLVLLHGWAMHGGAWDEAIEPLARRYRVHAVDLPGHGRSPAAGDGSFDAAVDGVADALPEGGTVCGWSLGGLFAQRLAVRHPARVARVVLVATTPCFARRDGWDSAMDAATLEAFAGGLEEDRAATLRDFVSLNALHGARGREAIRAFATRLDAHGAPDAGTLAATLAWLRDTDLRADAPRIAQPALVVHGARDALTPIAAARWLAAALPHARLVEIDDAAHLPFFTHRDAFVAALESFVG